MNIKNALLICAHNFVLIWKQLVYALLISLIVGLCLWGTLTPIIELLSNEGWFESLLRYLESIYKAPAEMAVGFEMLFSELWGIFTRNASFLWGNYIVSFLLLLIIPNIAFYMSYFTTGDLVNAKLCSAVNYGYIHRFLMSLKRSVPYALFETIIKLPFVGLQISAFLLYGILSTTWIKATLLLPVLILVLLLISAVRRTLMIWFMPECATSGDRVYRCLGRSFKLVFKNFTRLMLSNFLLLLVEFAGVMILTVFTIGAGLIVLIPAIPVINAAFSLVSYYQISSMRYYIDSNTIVNPVQD